MNNMRATFLMIARILYDKGYKEYTHAARIIRGKYPEARFELLGKIDQEYPNHVPESVVRHDHAEGVIHYLGFVSDVREIIRQADCIVLPTFYNEGLSRVLMEAMALRKSIITTNIPGCKETVEEGRNGFLVPPRDVDALAQAGVDSVAGRLCADVSMKDTLQWGWGWCWDDEMERLTPLLYNGKDCFMAEFFSALQDDSIKSRGTFSYGITPHEGEVFCLVSRYHTIDQILMPMMKESDNMYAEALFYQIGAGKGNDYATAEHSAARIKELINRIGLDASRYRIADGSGLSLYNYSSPELLVAMLRYAHSRTNIFEHLYYSLPVAGVDGTLSRRMLRTSAESNVYAKTGTLEGVSTLAGYAWSRDRHLLAFAIMNQGILRTRHAHAFQNKVCRILTE